MKKLLIATDTYFPKRDGVTVFMKYVVPKLSTEFETTILAPRFEKEVESIGNAKLILLPVSKIFKVVGYNSIKFSASNIKKIKEAVKNADIVFIQDIAPIGLLSLLFAKKYNKKVIMFFHQVIWEQATRTIKSVPKRFLLVLLAMFFVLLFDTKSLLGFLFYAVNLKRMAIFFLNKCDTIAVPYADLRAKLRTLGIKAKMVTARLGIAPDIFKPAESKKSAKASIGIDPEYFVIGYCGRISPEKNLTILLDAFKRLQRKGLQVFLLIVGYGPEKELKHFKNVNNVRITGFVDNVVPYVQAMDVFVMPSLTETTSLATLEAMACGVPVIVSKVGYMKEYVSSRFNGLFFPKNNQFMLAERIEELLKDAEFRLRLSKNAHTTVVEKFSWARTTAALLKIIKRMCMSKM